MRKFNSKVPIFKPQKE